MTAFHKWLLTAPPGATTTYYVGNLAAERGAAELRLADRTPALGEADAAWLAATNGLVNLVQRASEQVRRDGSHEAFYYIAQRTTTARQQADRRQAD